MNIFFKSSSSLALFTLLLAVTYQAAAGETTTDVEPVAGAETYSQWVCRPLAAGNCAAPHSIESTCDLEDGSVGDSCCPANIIARWSDGKNRCEHYGGLKSNNASDVESMDVGSATAEEDSSASSLSLATAAVFAVLGLLWN